MAADSVLADARAAGAAATADKRSSRSSRRAKPTHVAVPGAGTRARSALALQAEMAADSALAVARAAASPDERASRSSRRAKPSHVAAPSARRSALALMKAGMPADSTLAVVRATANDEEPGFAFKLRGGSSRQSRRRRDPTRSRRMTHDHGMG